MMKILLFLFFLLNALLLPAQEVTFSPHLLEAEDKEIVKIIHIWGDYIMMYANDVEQETDYASIHWNDEEKERGLSHMVFHSLSIIPLLMWGEVFTYDIRKTDDYYCIHSILYGNSATLNNIYAVFKTLVKKTDDGYKLYNYFHSAKEQMKDYKTKNITYFYPKNYDFNKKKAREAENFISRMRKEYDLSESRSVIYLVGNNVDECNSFLGHDYTFASSAQKAAGLYMPAQENFRHHLILSARPDHFHELVHSVFIYNYPKAALLFHEGIATYYGGNAGRDYKALCKELDKILENNPDIDISDFDSLNMMLDDGINPMYVIGARLIDYANRLGGKEKVLTLFKYGNSDVYEALEKELGLKQSDIKQVLYK